MRNNPHIQNIWDAGGPFVGEDGAPNGIVTVQTDWFLHLSNQSEIGRYARGPIRWWKSTGSDTEFRVPGVKSIEWDRSIDTDVATCKITVYNARLFPVGQTETRKAPLLGDPGFLSPHRGERQANARWGTVATEWTERLVVGGVLHTYQGYGGTATFDNWRDDITNGYVEPTGVWSIDDISVGTNGLITYSCRDMGSLLIDTNLLPPLVPRSQYPQGLRWCRWNDTTVTTQRQVTHGGENGGKKRCVYQKVGVSEASASDVYDGKNGAVHGHRPTDAFDNADSTFWLSVGNSDYRKPFATEWLEAACGEDIDEVEFTPWGGGYQVFVSVMENGAWVTGGGTVPYGPAGVGLYTGNNAAAIPFVVQGGCNTDAPTRFKLPRTMKAQKVRISMTNLVRSQWGPFHYRAGIRHIALYQGRTNTTTETVTETNTVRTQGDYTDYLDIVKAILLWCGFWLKTDISKYQDPEVFGDLETTGAYSEECLDESHFEKRTPMEVINELKSIVGYIFRVGEEGQILFKAPNFWSPGNFYEDGTNGPTDFTPVVDERKQLSEYSVQESLKDVRSEIIIASDDPNAGFDDTISTTVVPASSFLLKGRVRPAIWSNAYFRNEKEQLILAQLVAIHLFFAIRQANVTIAANPCLTPDTQIRIYEQVTSETNIHYIRGISCQQDLDDGAFTMQLTTHWLGDDTFWALNESGLVTGYLEDWVRSKSQDSSAYHKRDTRFRTFDPVGAKSTGSGA